MMGSRGIGQWEGSWEVMVLFGFAVNVVMKLCRHSPTEPFRELSERSSSSLRGTMGDDRDAYTISFLIFLESKWRISLQQTLFYFICFGYTP